jgi:sugar lactone lactonase YvrE
MVDYRSISKRPQWLRRVAGWLALLGCGMLLSGLFGAGWSLRHVWAARTRTAPVATLTLSALPTQAQFARDGAGAVVAGFEGVFDTRTKQFLIQPAQSAEARTQNLRVDPSGELVRGTHFSFAIPAPSPIFIGSGDLAGNISGEIQLRNLTNVALYNTRLLFTKFKVCPVNATTKEQCNGQLNEGDATTSGPLGFSYYNDGLLPYGGKLNISRAYKEVLQPNETSNAVWTFNLAGTSRAFFFAFVVLADLGVAAESVYPAAVQVDNNNGASLVLRGQGFTGTPTVTLLNAAGQQVATLGSVAVANNTQLTATVPPGTPPGIYSVRVTLAGGTPGGINSSTLMNRLTVTGVPNQTLTGVVNSVNGTGPFLITGDITLNSEVTVLPGTVFYLSNNARIILGSAGNLKANGGIPGVPNGASVANPAQIVFTVQRSPGAQLPNDDTRWGGIDATASAGAVLTLRNAVVEYDGANNKPNVDLTGSGRTLRFTDSIARLSGGAGLALGGSNDMLTGFTRNRIEYNGRVSGTPAMIVSANAALGLFEIPPTTGLEATPLNTFISDPSYFYSAANVFTGNQVDAIQIPTTSNDFTRSGVLVGQGTTPIQLRGGSNNPAIVGAAPPAAPAELTISPTALIQLDSGMDFQAGDYGLNLHGGIAANGFAGVNQATPPTASSTGRILFRIIPGGSPFGAIVFSRNTTGSSILSFVDLTGGGAGDSTRNSRSVVIDGVSLPITNSQIAGGFLELNGAAVKERSVTTPGNPALLIYPLAGGLYGDGNPGTKATLASPIVAAADPQGRGVYFVDNVPNAPALLRFLNTTRNPVTIAGIKIAGGTVKTVAGGGIDLLDNVKALQADLGIVSGLAVSPGTGDVIYFIDKGGALVRFINVSSGPLTINGSTVNAGNVGTFSSRPDHDFDYGSTLNGMATLPNGDVLVMDATGGRNRVYKIPPTGGSGITVAGNGSGATKAADPFSPGVATNTPLLAPRAVAADANGNFYVADTGHGRIIKVAGGQASLVAQFTPDSRTRIDPYDRPPYPSGLAVIGNKVFIALGSAHQIRVVEGASNTVLTGAVETSCDYSSTNCGDGGPAASALLNLIGSSPDVPLASLAADANGIFICDQGGIGRGRIRYINVSGNAVELAGVTVPANVINTLAGAGFPNPYDGGLATGGELRAPGGVAVDPNNGNLWIADTIASKLRYVNRTNSTVTLFSNFTGPDMGNRLAVPPGAIVTVNRDVGKIEGVGTDDVPAVQAGFDTPQGLTVTAEGVYIVDTKKGPAQPCTSQSSICRRTSLIRFLNTSNQTVTFYANAPLPFAPITVPPGFVKTIAGGGVDSNRDVNDGPDPLNAKFTGSADITLASNGDMYVADAGNGTVRKITRATGAVARFLGLSGYNALALNQATNQYSSVLLDSAGRLLVLDTLTHRLLRENSPGSGLQVNGFRTLLTGTPLNEPRDMAFDAAGNLYVTNAGTHTIIKLTLGDTAATGSAVVGTIKGYSGDFGLASQAQLDFSISAILVSTGFGSQAAVRPQIAITAGLNNEIIFTDSKNNAVRRLR